MASISPMPMSADDFRQRVSRLGAGAFYALGGAQTLALGISDAVRTDEPAIAFDSSMGILTITVGGQRVGLQPSDVAWRHQCDCTQRQAQGSCRHVAAAAAMVGYVLQGRWLGREQPSPRQAANWRTALDQALKAKSPQASERRRYFRLDGNPYPALVWNDLQVPAGFQEFLYSARYQESPGNIQPKLIFPMLSEENLLKLLRTAAVLQIPVVHQREGSPDVTMTGKIVPWDVRYGLAISSDRGNPMVVPLISRDPSTPTPRGPIGDDLWILDTGDLGKCVHTEHKPYLDLICAYGPGSGPQTATWVTKFNERSLAVSTGDPSLGADLLPLRIERTVVPMPDWKTPAELELTVNLTPQQHYESHDVQVSVSLDQEDISLVLLLEQLERELQGTDSLQKLIRAKRRAARLAELVVDLAQQEKKSLRQAFITQAGAEDVFATAGQTNAAKRWLRAVAKHFFEPDFPRLMFIRQRWVWVSPVTGRLLQLLLGLNRAARRDERLSLIPNFQVANADLGTFLRLASVVCAAYGATLRRNGAVMRSMPIQIAVEAVETKEIDWFELKAEIRVGEYTIPQSEWERLIRGDFTLERNGEFIVPALAQADALARLRELLAQAKPKSKGKGKGGDPLLNTPRLQLLDWLELRRAGASVKLPAEAEAVFNRLANFEDIPAYPLPEGLHAELRPYQARGYEWLRFLYEHRFGACLADDMGLGKTLQAIAFLAAVVASEGKRKKGMPPHLIVVPPSLVFNWRSELERFTPHLPVVEYLGGARDADIFEGATLVLTTYDSMRIDIDLLAKRRFGVVVFDETQLLKNLSAARTKAALQLQRRFTLCLTGTPMENHVGEYYSILNLAVPGLFGDYDTFRRRLKDGDDGLLRRARPFVLRRTKTLILKDLPPKVESDLHLDMTPEQREIYTRTVAEIRAEVAEAYQDKTQAQAGIVALAALMRLRQVCISPELFGRSLQEPAPKLAYLLDKLQELLEEGHAPLIFSQFTRSLDLFEASAQAAGLPVLRLDGQTPLPQRRKVVQQFQEDPQPHGFLISLKAGGVGLNLTRASYVFHLDPWWNPAVENQASDRAHRIGQQNTVFVQRLIMRHTIEEKMVELKRRKQALFDALVENPAERQAEGPVLSRDDFDYLLGA